LVKYVMVVYNKIIKKEAANERHTQGRAVFARYAAPWEISWLPAYCRKGKIKMNQTIRRGSMLCLCIVLLFVLLASGCSVERQAQPSVSPQPSVQATNMPTPAPTPTPTPTPEPTPAPVPYIEIQYDHFLLSKRYRELLSDDLYDLYCVLVQSVLDYENEVEIPEHLRNDPNLRFVTNIFQRQNPLEFLSGTPFYSVDGSRFEMEFRLPKEEHDEKLKQIGQRIEEIIHTNIQENYNALDASIAFYRYLSMNTLYTMETESTEAYGILMNQEGVCTGFAHAMQILLTQSGYDDGYAAESTPDDPEIEGHAWNVLQFGSEWYHVDATWENTAYAGWTLNYFGMTDEERSEGLVGRIGIELREEEPMRMECTDEAFVMLHDTIDYRPDLENHRVIFQVWDGGWYVLDTQTLNITPADVQGPLNAQ
jgi:hypothetical protein